jgi:hypothetical protein
MINNPPYQQAMIGKSIGNDKQPPYQQVYMLVEVNPCYK